jgi:iron complex outermembrane receptor protein
MKRSSLGAIRASLVTGSILSGCLAGGGALAAGADQASGAPKASGGVSVAENNQSRVSVGEIIVTAQKREQALSRVPMAVSALTGEQLSARGYSTMMDLTGAVPNLNVAVNSSQDRVNARGVFQTQDSPGSDPAVAFHVNGIYMPDMVGIMGSLYDISRIEVLLGPQGTLYGRNATGGVVNVITNLPTSTYYVGEQVQFGNYGAISTRSVLSGPITDKLLFRLAVATDNHDGYALNLFDGRHYDNENSQSGRLTLSYEPSNKLKFITYADYHREDDGNYATHYGGQAISGSVLAGVAAGGMALPVGPDGLTLDPRLLDDINPTVNKRTSWGIAEVVQWSITDNISFKSISSYRHSNLFYGSDLQATTYSFPTLDPFTFKLDPEFNYIVYGKEDTFSQELELAGKTSRINWIAGAFYLYDEVSPGGFTLGQGPVTAPVPKLSGGTLIKPAYAIFGQATYQITSDLGLTVGLRYNWDSNRINSEFQTIGGALFVTGKCKSLPGGLCHLEASTSSSKVTPRAEIHYQWTPNLMTYASVAEGFESGGFKISALTPAFLPATVWSYEVGVKAQTPDHHWSGTLAAFHEDYSNIQVSEIIQNITSIVNAAAAKANGIEFTAVAQPFRGLTITDAFAYLDARYTDFTEQNPNAPFQGPPGVIDNKGHFLQYSVPYSNNVRASYEFPLYSGHVTLAGEWNWRAKEYFSEENDSLESMPANSTYNASIRFTNDPQHWYVELWGKNLSNALIVSQQNIGGCGCLNSQYSPPRTYGITLDYQY